MAVLSRESTEQVAAIEALTGSLNYATWKRLLISYLKARQVWDVVSGEFERPDCLFKYVKPIASDIGPLIDRSHSGAVRQNAIATRLETEVQAFEYYRKWSQCEAEAYHTILRYLSPEVSIHAAGIGTSRELWLDLEERYSQMELATYCELFAQLKETTTDSCNSTREFVDRVRLLVNRLNGIAPDSIGDKAHIAILLTQVGPEYAFIVDAIQNDRETIHATAVGTRLANADRAVRGKESASRSAVTTTGSINSVKTPVKKCTYCKKRGHEVQKCWKKNPHLRPARKDNFANADRNDSSSPHCNSSSLSQQEDRQGPPASKRQKVHVVRARATALYTRAPNPQWILDSAATSHICWDRDCFIDLRPHREMLETAGDPVETEGIGTVKLSLRGKPPRTLVLKKVYYAPRIGMNLVSVPKLLRDRYSVVAHPSGIRVQRGRHVIGSAYHTEDDLLVLRCTVSGRPLVHVSLARSSTHVAGTLESQVACSDVEPPELSDTRHTAVTSELHDGEAMVLEEEAVGDGRKPEELWHARLGHLNRGDLRDVLRQSGTPYRPLTSRELQATPRCPACMAGKQHRKRFSRRRRPHVHSKRMFEVIHSDLTEMPPGRDGSRYVITFTDDYSRGSWAYAMKSKSQALHKFQLFEAWVYRQFDAKIRRFLCDNGGEFLTIGAYLEAQGVEFDTSAPYCKQQNGLAERTNRTIKERINTILMDANLPRSFWTEILDTVTYLKLRAPASILRKKTPYEILYGKPPRLSHLRRVGSRAWVLIPQEQRDKIDPRSSKCRLLGYSEPDQYKLYEVHSGRIIFSRDVEFDEQSPVAPVLEGEVSSNITGDQDDIGSTPIPAELFPDLTPPKVPSGSPEYLPSTDDLEPVNPNAVDESPIPDLGYSLYGRRRYPSRRLLEAAGKAYFTQSSHRSTDHEMTTPLTFAEATSGPDAPKWWDAIHQEFRSLIDHGTWEKVSRKEVPAGYRIIGCKWVFKVKANNTLKARLVIKGYRQKKDIDYHETFAAVSRMDSVRAIIAGAVLQGWTFRHLDAKTAFLHGDADTAIYMELPEGFTEEGYVCRLRRSLYGLKQAPRIWYQCVKRVLVAHGFTMAEADNCVFYHKNCVICVYVDDFLVVAASEQEIRDVKDALESEFTMSDLGTPHSFLGIQFTYHDDGSVSLHQQGYIRKILSDFCMEECQAKSTPMHPKVSLNPSIEEEDLDESAKARYGSAIGALMYLMTGTRPDIAFALATLSRFLTRPQSHHQAALQRVLRYLKGTQTLQITYRKGQLIGYTDADFGGTVVTEGAYSTSGYVFKLAGGPICWSSKKQGEIATSTTHAEYIGQYNAILHLQWLRTFLEETGMYRSPVTHIMADNQSAIALSHNPEFHKRTKHFNVKLHYQRSILEQGSIDIRYIPTTLEAADGLTKPLGPTELTNFIRLIGMKGEIHQPVLKKKP